MNIRIRDIQISYPEKFVDNQYFIDLFDKKGKDIRGLLKALGREKRSMGEYGVTSTVSIGAYAALKVLKSSGLSGEDIPLHARIMAIADVFDAVSAKRCYRDAMPIEKCFKIIEEGSGKDFDPNLVEAFLNAKEEILKYYEQDK